MNNQNDDINLLDTETESLNPDVDSPQVRLAKLLKQKQMLELINPSVNIPKIDTNSLNAPELSTPISANTQQKQELNNIPTGLNEQQLKDLQTNYLDPREYAVLDAVRKKALAGKPPVGKKTPAVGTEKDTSEIPLVLPTDTYSTKLAELQDRSNRMASLMDLGKAMSAASATMVGGKADEFIKSLQGMKEGIEATPKQFVELKEQEKNDPTSDISKQYRAVAAKMGFGEQTKNSSAANIEKMFPQLTTMFTASEAQKARHQDLMLKLQELGLKRQELFQTKFQSDIERDRQKMGDTINFNKQAKGNAAQVANLTQQADRIQTIIDTLPKKSDGEPDLNKVTPTQKQELLRTFDVMLQGKSTVSGQQELMHSANSIYNDVAKIYQYVSGSKAYGNEGKILKGIVDTINREKGLAFEKVKDMAFEGASSFTRLKKYDPQGFNDLLKDKALMEKEDILLREKGFRGYDISRLENLGYSKQELVKLASSGIKPSEIKPKTINEKNPLEEQVGPRSGLTPEQRRKRIEELKSKLGQ